MSTTCVAVVRVEDHDGRAEELAVAGFLAGYCGTTRRSYATDLRLFASWCHEANLTLFNVRRAHLELFGRWMRRRDGYAPRWPGGSPRWRALLQGL